MSRHTTDGRADGVAPLPPDDDIAALFDAQTRALDVPPELDARVRAAARAALSENEFDTTPAPDERAERASGDTLHQRRPPRWLAAAAVVGLAVALLPLARQAPESPSAPVVDGAPSPSPADMTIASDVGASDAAARVTERRETGATEGVTDGATAGMPDDVNRSAESASAASDTSNLFPSDETAPTARRKATSESAFASAPALAPHAAGADRAAGTEAGDDVMLDPIVAEIERRRQSDAADTQMSEEAVVAEEAETDAAFGIAPNRTTADPTNVPQEPRSVVVESSRSPGVPRSTADAASFARADTVPVTDPFDGYRENPTRWLDRLRERLRADGLTPRLEAEYRRFRSAHADVEPAFDPEAVAREGDTTRR